VVAVFIALMVISTVLIGLAVTRLTATTKGGTASGSVEVTIRDYFFNPENITVPVNTTVSWTNNGSMAHTVTALSGAPVMFDSSTLNPGSVFTYRFTVLGTYPYFCKIHTFMRGNVTVVGSTPPSSVSIVDFAFNPQNITVKMGTTVKWTNNGASIHTVNTLTGAFLTFDS